MKASSTCVLTAVNVLAAFVLASQATRLVAQGIQLSGCKFRLVLEIAEFAILAVAAKMPARYISRVSVATVEHWKLLVVVSALRSGSLPMITHLLADFLHACFERSCGSRIFRWQWLIKSLTSFVVISVFLLSVFLSSGRSRCDRNAAVFRSTGFANGGWTLVSNASNEIDTGCVSYPRKSRHSTRQAQQLRPGLRWVRERRRKLSE